MQCCARPNYVHFCSSQPLHQSWCAYHCTSFLSYFGNTVDLLCVQTKTLFLATVDSVRDSGHRSFLAAKPLVFLSLLKQRPAERVTYKQSQLFWGPLSSHIFGFPLHFFPNSHNLTNHTDLLSKSFLRAACSPKAERSGIWYRLCQLLIQATAAPALFIYSAQRNLLLLQYRPIAQSYSVLQILLESFTWPLAKINPHGWQSLLHGR